MIQEIHAAEFLPAPLSAALAVVWIVLMINSVNFLDNMDGLSAGVVILCGGFLVAAGAINGQFFVPGLMLVVIGSAGGFLVHNFPPARLFMGDSGSLVLGYFVGLLSVLTVFTTDADHHQAAMLMPLIMMAIPLYDTATVILVRVIKRAELLKGDRNHFSHRLAARGMSDRAVLAAVCLATCATGLAGVFLVQLPPQLAWVVFAQTLCVLGVIGFVEWHWAAPGRNDKPK
jgi:UDP-GlcNAc:undecaprenyl-phosphate GlcNAc-1-phosphate transferase